MPLNEIAQFTNSNKIVRRELTPIPSLVFLACYKLEQHVSGEVTSYIQSDQSVAAVAAAQRRRRRRQHGGGGGGRLRHGSRLGGVQCKDFNCGAGVVWRTDRAEMIEGREIQGRALQLQAPPRRPAAHRAPPPAHQPTLLLVFFPSLDTDEPIMWLCSSPSRALLISSSPSLRARGWEEGKEGEEGRRSEEQQRRLSIFATGEGPRCRYRSGAAVASVAAPPGG